MNKRLSFKEYYESKKNLLAACDSVPRIRNEYRLTKYCKFPVFEALDGDEKVYVSFKPKDKIEILWERANEFDDYPTAKCMVLLSESKKEVFPCWNNKKIHRWIASSTIES
jgi:hypothetical protein